MATHVSQRNGRFVGLRLARVRLASSGVGRRWHDGLVSTIVFLHAHPDDEASQTAGAMARAVAEGHRVVTVFATNGDHGEIPADGLPEGETLVHWRRREAR